MSSDWPLMSLGDLVRLQRGHDLPASEQRPGPYPVMGSAGPNGSHDVALAPGPGVVIGRSGASAGRVHYTPSAYWPHNTCLYVTDFLGNSPRFASYLLGTLNLGSFNSGSAQPSLNRNYIYSIPVRIPSRREQDEIAGALSILDERIALLHETIATLEAIAQALFKSWFVDFAPVRAKMEGLAPDGIDEATAALFPSELHDAAGTVLPIGWQVSNLTDLVASHGGAIQTGPFGSQLHAADYVSSGRPVVMPKDIAGRRISTDSIARVSQENADRLARHKLQPGDIVFSRRGDVEKHALVSSREAGWLCGTGCLLVRPGARWPSPTFLSMLLDAQDARAWLVRHAVGATMPNLNTSILGSVPVLLPPTGLLAAFESVVAALESKRGEASAAGETLAEIRDTLLPRLVSGKLRLPEAESLLSDSAAA